MEEKMENKFKTVETESTEFVSEENASTLIEVCRHNDFVLYEVNGEDAKEIALFDEEIRELFPDFEINKDKYYIFSKGDEFFYSER